MRCYASGFARSVGESVSVYVWQWTRFNLCTRPMGNIRKLGPASPLICGDYCTNMTCPYKRSFYISLVFTIQHATLYTGQCCGSGSGIRCCLTPGSGIRNRFFPDAWSRIPNPYFWELCDNFLGKKFYNSLKICPNFFFNISKIKKFNFVKFMAHKKVMTTNFFHPCLSLLFLDPGSEIRDGKNQDPG